jgi:hypothetical protein
MGPVIAMAMTVPALGIGEMPFKRKGRERTLHFIFTPPGDSSSSPPGRTKNAPLD